MPMALLDCRCLLNLPVPAYARRHGPPREYCPLPTPRVGTRGILASLRGAANRWAEADGTPTRPHAVAGEGTRDPAGGEPGRCSERRRPNQDRAAPQRFTVFARPQG